MLLVLAQVVVVGAGAHSTVAAALAAARPGDTVVLRAGIHHGPVRIDRPVTLVGEPGAVLDGDGRGDVVRIVAPHVTVARLAIQHSGTALERDDAAIRIMATDARVAEVTIRESLHGIYLQDAAYVTLAGNRIIGHARLAEPDRGNGIHLHASRHVRIERNVIERVRDGLYFSYSDSTEALGNTVTRSRYGIHFMYSRGNRFIANRFVHNAGGAALMYSWDLVAAGNTFTDHDSYRGYGIALQTTERARLIGNRFERNTIGIFLDNALNGALLENVVANNGLGLDMLSSVEGNTLAANAFVGNGVAARRAPGPDANRWEQGGRGNFWDGAAALDLDGDGVRDRPHREGSAFGALASARPALHLWRASPAMAVLDIAERSLPVFRVPAIVDSAPLTRLPDGATAGAPGPGGAGRRLTFLALTLGLCAGALLVFLGRPEA